MMELLKRATLIWLGWMSKLTWEQILRTYDVTRGDLWALILVWVAVLPLVLTRMARARTTTLIGCTWGLH
jgi:hypothetical protein